MLTSFSHAGKTYGYTDNNTITLTIITLYTRVLHVRCEQVFLSKKIKEVIQNCKTSQFLGKDSTAKHELPKALGGTFPQDEFAHAMLDMYRRFQVSKANFSL